ncbi:MAG: CpaD family pilus assembly protein [Alphaproteobacteria bacterium]|nr:CpaD family pilus assembly protein [Alphaproteobacteria bacterium]
MTSSASRFFAAAALLLLSSCATTPDKHPEMMMADGAANHPITVEPSYRALKLGWSPAGLTQPEQVQFDAFVSDYLAHGNGSIAVSVPATMGGQNAALWFAGRINDMGVGRDKILIASHDTAGDDMRVEVNYVSYQAHTDACGDWSDDLAFTLMNTTPKNFGCSVQQNIAAMVADPRDLLGPRPLGESDAARRATVLSNYEQGKVTSAEKRKADLSNEQSGLSNASQ